jgi:hypothetical protein
MLPDSPDRTPLHTRTLTFRGFARDDGLWDLEGELHDSKHYGYDSSHGPCQAGTPIHHMHLRVTVDESLLHPCHRDRHGRHAVWRMPLGRRHHAAHGGPDHGAGLAPDH